MNEKNTSALQTGLNQLRELWEDPNLSKPVKQEFIDVLNNLMNESTRIDRDASFLTHRDKDGDTALHVAAQHNSIKVLAELLAYVKR
ncbi:hypothetical protein [Candidatus Tisiphia endosymbiont of Beris chalybata]|uniref:hypothetical protein n=1 Tax=Candidatus Tisiphia endosymbiont of Beris chalybata TaxID=3066262 RepID=UPI00312C72A9